MTLYIIFKNKKEIEIENVNFDDVGNALIETLKQKNNFLEIGKKFIINVNEINYFEFIGDEK